MASHYRGEVGSEYRRQDLTGNRQTIQVFRSVTLDGQAQDAFAGMQDRIEQKYRFYGCDPEDVVRLDVEELRINLTPPMPVASLVKALNLAPRSRSAGLMLKSMLNKEFADSNSTAGEVLPNVYASDFYSVPLGRGDKHWIGLAFTDDYLLGEMDIISDAFKRTASSGDRLRPPAMLVARVPVFGGAITEAMRGIIMDAAVCIPWTLQPVAYDINTEHE